MALEVSLYRVDVFSFKTVSFVLP